MAFNYKRVSIVTGHYGSGKSNIAINMALDIRKQGHMVTVIDLDIVNPYFRSADCEKLLADNDINLIKPIFANTNLDAPALPPSVMQIFNKKESYFVIDVGGDDSGAVALGRYNQGFLTEDYDLFYCINCYRFLTQNSSEAIELLYDIQKESRLIATKLINNSNLGTITTKEDVITSYEYANNISKITNLPIALVGVSEELYANHFNDDNSQEFFPVKIHINKY